MSDRIAPWFQSSPTKARKVRRKAPVRLGWGICRHCQHETDEWPIRRANGKTGPGVVCCPACGGPEPRVTR